MREADGVLDKFYNWLKDGNIRSFIECTHGRVEYYVFYNADDDEITDFTTASTNWFFHPDDHRTLIQIYHSRNFYTLADSYDRWRYEPYIGLTNLKIAIAEDFISEGELGDKQEEFQRLCGHYIDNEEIDNPEERYEEFIDDREINKLMLYSAMFADFTEQTKDNFLEYTLRLTEEEIQAEIERRETQP